MSGRAQEAVDRWARRVHDRRRFHVARRAFDGKWAVWKKRMPPAPVSMEWVAVHVAQTRREALGHLRKLVDAQHKDNAPGTAKRGRSPAGRAGTGRRPLRPSDGDKSTTPPPVGVRESLHT